MKRRPPVRASQPRKGKGRLFYLTVFLSVLSILTLGIGGLTFVQANRLMRRPGQPMKPYTANAMPQYMPVSFLSGDEQTRLNGWFFLSSGTVAGATVILIHPHHGNRAPFEDATGRLIFRLNEAGYNVLTFDQRHAGDSDGALTTYGYAEWQDVIGAMGAVHRITGSADCVLCAIGSGITAALKAWQQLPETAGGSKTAEAGDRSPSAAGSDTKSREGSNGNAARPELPFGRPAVKALVLDTPLPNADDYIRRDVVRSGAFAHQLTCYTVPLAVRLTAELSKPMDIQTETARLPRPVLLMKNSASSGADDTDAQNRVIAARQKAHPGRTQIFEAPAKAGDGPRTETGIYRTDPDGYTDSLIAFLNTFVG